MKQIEFKSRITFYADLMDEGTNFDNVEIHPLVNIGTKEDTELVICDEDDAELYGVYIHIPESGIECIADCDSLETANDLSDILLKTGRLFIKQ